MNLRIPYTFLRATILFLLISLSVSANKLDCLVDSPYCSPKLSPDGMHLAIIARDRDGVKSLMLVDIDQQNSDYHYPRDSKKGRANVVSFAWVTHDTLIVISDAYKGSEALNIYQFGDRVMRTLEAEGKYSVIDPLPHTTRYLVSHRPANDEWGVCTIEERDASDLAYCKVLESFSSRVLECVTDSDHQPRVVKMNKGENEEPAWYWNNGFEWVPTQLPHGTRVHGLKYGQKNVAFIGGSMDEPLPALYFYNFETGSVDSKLLEHSVYSIARFAQPLSQGHPNAVLGYFLNVDVPRDVWLSKKMDGLQEIVDKLFEGTRNLILDWDEKQEHLLIKRVLMDAPSHLVWLDAKTQASKLLLIEGGRVAPEDIGRSSVVQVINRRGVQLTAMLTIPRVAEVKNLPLVVYVRPDPWNDLDRYGWCSEAQYMAANGFVVLRMNMRGSAGTLGKHSLNLNSANGLQGFFEDIDDGVAEILKTGIIDAECLAIAGSGKGAWVAACAPTVCKTDFKAVVALNGVYDLIDYREKAHEEESVRSTLQISFADPQSGLTDQELARFSPMQNLVHYAEALFVSVGKWSYRDFENQAFDFMSEARRHDVLVKSYSDDWWGNKMKPDQRIRAWRDGVDLLTDVFKKE